MKGATAVARSRRLAELYQEHAPEATRLAYLLCGDHELAQDLVQDAFVKMAGRFGHLRSPDAFGPYLRKVVVNSVRSHFRRAKVERDFLSRQSAFRAHDSEGIPDVGERDQFQEALLALPYMQRAAIVLRHYEDRSEAQAADLLGCSPSALRSALHRGIASLRRGLEGEDHDG